MSVSRFAAGVGAGAAIAALLAGTATMSGSSAAEPDNAVPQAETTATVRSVPTSPKEEVARGVLARAAASRRAKTGGSAGTVAGTAAGAAATGAAAPAQDGATAAAPANASKEAVIESVEVDWGATQPRP